ncbi:winged helix-turn-helix transcriptional regulator [Rhizobium fabae]|uniref:HTH hxlR-type domain-containing protein n=1 Tax=Rhizobium fabae TaxID=573179 RepID=A0ABY0AZT2_9HYPH|nr:hypothetical protein EFB14_31880 [Rhizobium fabae]
MCVGSIISRGLGGREKRFSEIKRSVPGISQWMLTFMVRD